MLETEHKHYRQTHQHSAQWLWLTNIVLLRSSNKRQVEMYDIRSKLYSVHFKPWMFIFARLKLYLFCIQESKKNNCTTPHSWQKKSFCRPLKSVHRICPGLVQFVTWKSFKISILNSLVNINIYVIQVSLRTVRILSIQVKSPLGCCVLLCIDCSWSFLALLQHPPLFPSIGQIL